MALTSYQCKAGGQNVVNTGDHRGIIQLASLRKKSKYEMKRRRNVDREGNISKCTNVSACCIVKRTHQSLAMILYVWSFVLTSCVAHHASISATCNAYCIPLLPCTSPFTFKSPSPRLKGHRGHHADKHDIEDGVGELHGAFKRQDQHA